MKTTSPTIPTNLVISITAKWIEGKSIHFKLKLSNTENKREMAFDYSGGCLAFLPKNAPDSIRKALSRPVRTLHDEQEFNGAMQWQLERTKPEMAGVLWSLTLDAQAGENNFDDFCADFGYDSDSHKALALWEVCQKQGREFRSLLGSGEAFNQLEESLRDY